MKKPSLTAANDSLLCRALTRGLPLWGRGTAIAVDEGFMRAGTARCGGLLCAVPHQPPFGGSFPEGKPKRRCGRRLLILHFLALLLLLASCGAKAPSAPRFSDGALAVTAEVTRGDFVYTAEFSRRDGARTLSFLAPETLAGLTVTDAGGVCRLSLGELTVESPDAAAFFTPFTLFDLPEGSLTGSREENGLTVYEGTRGEERFRVAVDAAGRPVRLEGNVGGEEIGVTVTKFEFDTPSEGTERERESA